MPEQMISKDSLGSIREIVSAVIGEKDPHESKNEKSLYAKDYN